MYYPSKTIQKTGVADTIGTKIILTPPYPVRISRFGLLVVTLFGGTSFEMDLNWRPNAGSATGEVPLWGGSITVLANILAGNGIQHTVGLGPNVTDPLGEGRVSSAAVSHELRPPSMGSPGEEVRLNVSDAAGPSADCVFFIEYEPLAGRGAWVTGPAGNMTEYAA